MQLRGFCMSQAFASALKSKSLIWSCVCAIKSLLITNSSFVLQHINYRAHSQAGFFPFITGNCMISALAHAYSVSLLTVQCLQCSKNVQQDHMTADCKHILCTAVTLMSVDDTSLCWNFNLCMNCMVSSWATSQKTDNGMPVFVYMQCSG